MFRSLHKKILIISLSVAVLTLLAGIAAFVFFKKPIQEILPVCCFFWFFSLVSFITSWVILKNEKSWIRKISRYSIFFLPLILVSALIPYTFFESNTFLFILILLVLFFLLILPLLHGFIFSDATTIKSTVAFIIIILISIWIKRFHFPFSGVILTITLSFFGLGSYMYGIRCIYLADKVSYLKYVAFFGSCIITVSLFGILFKQQHWPGGDTLINAGYFSLLLGTIVFLLTLPSAGLIDWPVLQKRILTRLLLPLALVFLLFLIRFLLPGINRVIWSPAFETKSDVKPAGFEMNDYKIEIKNGLKPE